MIKRWMSFAVCISLLGSLLMSAGGLGCGGTEGTDGIVCGPVDVSPGTVPVGSPCDEDADCQDALGCFDCVCGNIVAN